MKNQKKAYFYALLAVCFWSTAASAFKISLRHAPYNELLLYSVAVSVVVIAAYLAIHGRLISTFQVSRKELINSALLGLLNPFLYYIILFNAYNRLLAQEAVVLNYTWPVVLVLFSVVLLKQRITALGMAAVIVSFAGTVIIATKGDLGGFHFQNPVGVSLALGSAVFWALFWIYNIRDRREEEPKLLLNFLFGLGYILLYNLFVTGIGWPSLPAILGAAYIGLFELGITFVVWLKALKYSYNTARVANLIFMAPFLSLLIVSIAVGEPIRSYTLAGLAFIIGGIVLQRYSQA
jgi:drug/metabolite transporter (DMT)-like permease